MPTLQKIYLSLTLYKVSSQIEVAKTSLLVIPLATVASTISPFFFSKTFYRLILAFKNYLLSLTFVNFIHLMDQNENIRTLGVCRQILNANLIISHIILYSPTLERFVLPHSSHSRHQTHRSRLRHS